MRVLIALFIVALHVSGCEENSEVFSPPPVTDRDNPAGTAVFDGPLSVIIAIPVDAAGLTANAFGPNPLLIGVGTRVTWVNGDSVAHTTTSAQDYWYSGQLGVGQSFSYSFDNTGTYSYYCSNHTNMRGTIVVLPQQAIARR